MLTLTECLWRALDARTLSTHLILRQSAATPMYCGTRHDRGCRLLDTQYYSLTGSTQAHMNYGAGEQ